MAPEEYTQTSGPHTPIVKSGFLEGIFPLRYLIVPLFLARLSRSECAGLVDKIVAKVRTQSTRDISYACRCIPINSVLTGVIGFWAGIIILPRQVAKDIERSNDSHSKTPCITYEKVCLPKKYGRIGFRNIQLLLPNMFGHLQKKERITRRLGGSMAIILKTQHGGIINHDRAHAGTGKNCAELKTTFKSALHSIGTRRLLSQSGYSWLLGALSKVKWAVVVWDRSNIPKHSFIGWLLFHNRLPIAIRFAKFIERLDTTCKLCYQAVEPFDHLLLHCRYTSEVRNKVLTWIQCQLERNARQFQGVQQPPEQIIREIQRELTIDPF
ncbi:hypothetical protein Cgig2_024572 [Carnegiea gigantea]|uniref:Reverse transcriptase zinc-binding domain-containing protein n=1 Tax=Carnegiea gigantea TaxID=171969 RepID=A0A9Q1KK21_9CARY|nr:hypothetical protein Cgig2_024572 [Carnegiea gigantea]